MDGKWTQNIEISTKLDFINLKLDWKIKLLVSFIIAANQWAITPTEFVTNDAKSMIQDKASLNVTYVLSEYAELQKIDTVNVPITPGQWITANFIEGK